MTGTVYRWVALAAGAAILAGCAGRSTGGGDKHMASDRRIERQASAFESFMRRARGIDPNFSSPAEVHSALRVAAAYDPRQLEAGMIAYAAMAALQEPKFVAGVQDEKRRQRDLAAKLAANPNLALRLPAAGAAVSRASAALYRQGDALSAGGLLVKKASYSVQRQTWSKAPVSDPQGRLQQVRLISGAGYQPSGDDSARLYQAITQGGRSDGAPTAVVTRGVALAALSLLGADDKGASLMTEPKSDMCVRMAKLDFLQCLASAGPYYEDIFCLGQHAMIDPGRCAVEAAQTRSRTTGLKQ